MYTRFGRQETPPRGSYGRPAGEARLTAIAILNNAIQEYAWGSRTAIAELFGLPSPSDNPQAELWMGAHPKAPSRLTVDGREVPLDELIRTDAEGVLGREVARRFGNELPFLFKVIAAGAPLSIQVHPNAQQAREGFQRENEAGIPLQAFERNYRDAHHKPETLYPLSAFWALCGFRPIRQMLGLLRIAVPRSLKGELEQFAVEPSPEGLRRFFGNLMERGPERTEQVLEEAFAWASGPVSSADGKDPALPGGARLDTGRRPRDATRPEIRRWILRLHEDYPDDIGLLAPLFFNLVELQPGDVIYLGAGTPHAYLEGLGIELMASSDNVVRGGLTSKHVDVPELLRTLRFEGKPVEPVASLAGPDGETAFPTPAEEFLLSEIRLEPRRSYRSARRRNVQILLCVSGSARLTAPGSAVESRREHAISLTLGPGTSVLVPAAAPFYRLQGRARLFKATVP